MDLKEKVKELKKKLGRENWCMSFYAKLSSTIKDGYERHINDKNVIDKCESWDDILELVYMTCGVDLVCQCFFDIFQMILSMGVEFSPSRGKVFMEALEYMGNKYVILSG